MILFHAKKMMGIMMRIINKAFNSLFLIIIVSAALMVNCGRNKQLEPISFTLSIPNLTPDKYFHRVTNIAINDYGEILVMDVDGPGVMRFDVNGNFVSDIAGYGMGNYEALYSIHPIDSLIVVNTIGVIETFLPEGKPLQQRFYRGRGEIDVAPDGSYLINRMYDSFRLGYCLETYDENGKLIKQFRNPRCSMEGDEFMDFAFAQIGPDKQIIYAPTINDSIFIYDFQGNLLKAKEVETKSKPYKMPDGKPGATYEDICVSDGGIFLARIDLEKTTKEQVYVRMIEKYDFDLNYVESYSLPESITMTVKTDYYSPWYHKFVEKNGVFYFMISKPYEHLVAFQVK